MNKELENIRYCLDSSSLLELRNLDPDVFSGIWDVLDDLAENPKPEASIKQLICAKCFENAWTYEKIENYIRATCTLCGFEVEWVAAPNCCGQRCVKKPSKWKASKARKAYYYTHTFKCTVCNKTYLNEAFKVNNT